MNKLNLILSACALIVIFGGCQTVPYQGQAHDIKRKPAEEGVIGIPVNFKDEDRAKAELKMKSNCGELPYKITEEGEVAIGQETKSSGKETDRSSTEHATKLFGLNMVTGEAAGKNHESSQVVTSVKEWQIAYRCLASAADAGKKKVR